MAAGKALVHGRPELPPNGGHFGRPAGGQAEPEKWENEDKKEFLHRFIVEEYKLRSEFAFQNGVPLGSSCKPFL